MTVTAWEQVAPLSHAACSYIVPNNSGQTLSGPERLQLKLDFEGRVGEHAKGAQLKVALNTDFGQMSAKTKYKTNANTLGGA